MSSSVPAAMYGEVDILIHYIQTNIATGSYMPN